MLNGPMASAAASLDRVANGVSETSSNFTPYETVSSRQPSLPNRNGQFVFPLLPHAPLTLFCAGSCPWCLQSRWNLGHCPCSVILRASPGVSTHCSFLQHTRLCGGREGRGEAAGSKGSQLLSWPHRQAGR